MIGQTLSHYRITAKLGEGGMGEVYRAEDTTLDREVALKILPPELAGSQERLERFQREAKTLAALDHPNIVTIHTVEEAEGIHFLTMELVVGKSLDQLIPPDGLPLEQFLHLSVGLADALSEAHEQGVIHRDLKPGNIMIDQRGQPKVLDFGLAKLRQPESAEGMSQLPTEGMTEEGRVLGTYPYMSPEQVEGKAVDQRSDLFSLGTVLYEMATGERPFRGDSCASLMSSILRDTPEGVDTVKGGLPHHLSRIISRCLAKDPDNRYQRAKDLTRDLEELRQEVRSEVGALPRPGVIRVRRRISGQQASVGVFVLVVLVVLAYLLRPPERPEGPRITSLAVLPLENLSGDPSQEYFVDGMHEALTAELAKINALRVISRTSAMQYKGVKKPLPEIARELGVNGLVEGSVAREGDQVRITVRLIHGPTDEYLWTESHQRELRGVLSLQSQVAGAIADQIQVALTPEEAGSLTTAAPVDPAAYEDFLKGRYQWNKYTLEGWEASIGHFQSSIEKDRTYAPAHAMASFAYSLLGYYSLAPPATLHAQALVAAERAVGLDNSLAEAHASLGFVKTSFDWDWMAADLASQEALRLNRRSTMALFARSFFLSWVGRHEEAIAISERAVEVDPVAPHVNTWHGMHYFMARRYDEAIDQLKKVLTLEPDYRDAHIWLCYSYARTGRFEEAAREAAAVTGYRSAWWPEAWVLAGAGRPSQAQDLLSQFPAEEWEVPVASYFLALVLGEMGEKDRAFAALERAYRGRTPLMAVLRVDPRIDSLRNDARFQELVKRMNFPD